MRPPALQPFRREAAVILAALAVLGLLWVAALAPLSGRAGWTSLVAAALLLGALRLADPWVRRFSRWVSGKGRRPAGPREP